MADLIDLIKWRIAGAANGTQHPSAASQAIVVADEQTLGFALPPLLKRLYLEVGNGGWGPGNGILGLTGGAKDDLGCTAVEDYLGRRASSPEDPAWRWPEGLLSICHWGCGIYSCVSCLEPGFPMVVFDPNAHDDGQGWADAFYAEDIAFDRWMRLWAEGQDLWERLYAEGGVVAKAMQGRL